jgi:putative ABC transport system substrate-binding protein
MKTKITGLALGALLLARCLYAAVFLALCSMLLAPCFPARAQQPTKVARIGVLGNNPAANKEGFEAFVGGLKELGWTEGKNISIEYRWWEGSSERLAKFAAELVRLKVDLILAPNSITVEAARRETATIPIVFNSHGDPVGAGHVASLAHPGGNITGLAQLQAGVNAKGLELLKEILPKANRVAVLWNPKAPSHKPIIKAIEAMGRELKLRLLLFGINDVTELEKTFSAIARERADGAIVLQAPVFMGARQQLVDLALKYRLPTMFGFSEFVELGGLVSYGTNNLDLYRRSAVYVDKILKGAKPADLPVEQPKKFELAINLKAAKQIGLTIPQSVLYRADKVIK